MKLFKGAQKGFTLVELMVVMAIIAVLAAIVIPPVTGTKQVSSDSQVKQDASVVSSAVSKFNADQNLAQNTKDCTGTGLAVGAQQISNKWPEAVIVTGTTPVALTGQYTYDFVTGASPPTGVTGTLSKVSAVIIQDKDGITVYSSGNTTALANFVADYNAIDFDKLMPATGTAYLQAKPNGLNTLFEESGSSSSRTYNNYLWLLKKVNVDAAVKAGRVVEVYSLTTVTSTSSTADTLTYMRVY